MTACVFYDIDTALNKFIDSENVTFYSRGNKTISIEEYLKNCEDKENSERNISKLINKLYTKEIVEDTKINDKIPEKESTTALPNTDDYKFYPKMTTEEFFRKLSQDRIKRENIKMRNSIHNWYRYNREDIDELFFKGVRTFQDHGVEFTCDIQEMYDHFVEELFYKERS